VRSFNDRAEELRQQLTALASPPSTAIARRLNRLIADFARERRDLGWPPERVIIALKQVAQEAGLESADRVSTLEAEITARDELLADMVRWCIEAYYSPLA
jgi:hypothetical protein